MLALPDPAVMFVSIDLKYNMEIDQLFLFVPQSLLG